jgi:hypothetical protein
MVDPDLPASGPHASQPTPKIKGVADDMAAIFGPALRREPAALPVPVRAGRRRRKRGPWLAIFGAGGVVTMLAAGVIGGNTAMEAPATAPATRVAAKRVTAPPRQAPAAIEASPPVALAAATPTQPPLPAAVAEGLISEPAPPAAVPYAGPAAAVPQRSAPPRLERPAPAPDSRAAITTVSSQRAACYDEASCLAPQLRTAERSVAVAYDRATQAQVRAGTLRDYRDEWLRARRVALKRPREALRIYGMIASDLRVFAEDAPEDERVALR